jgi:hypothetical protein
VREEKGLRPGDFGLVLIRAIADDLLYNERRNEVVFVKYLDEPGDRPLSEGRSRARRRTRVTVGRNCSNASERRSDRAGLDGVELHALITIDRTTSG